MGGGTSAAAVDPIKDLARSRWLWLFRTWCRASHGRERLEDSQACQGKPGQNTTALRIGGDGHLAAALKDGEDRNRPRACRERTGSAMSAADTRNSRPRSPRTAVRRARRGRSHTGPKRDPFIPTADRRRGAITATTPQMYAYWRRQAEGHHRGLNAKYSGAEAPD